MSMISPDTSGAIFTSTSGWILPVAVTSWVTDLRNALSVVTSIGFSRFLLMTIAVRAPTISTARPIRMNNFFFDFVGCIAVHYERRNGVRVSKKLGVILSRADGEGPVDRARRGFSNGSFAVYAAQDDTFNT